MHGDDDDDEPEEGFALAYAAAYEEYALENAPIPVLQRIRLHPVRCAVLVALLAASAVRVRAVLDVAEPLWAVLAVVSGVFLADLLTGLVHLLADCTPLRARTKKSFWQWARCALRACVRSHASYGFHVHHAFPQDWNRNVSITHGPH